MIIYFNFSKMRKYLTKRFNDFILKQKLKGSYPYVEDELFFTFMFMSLLNSEYAWTYNINNPYNLNIDKKE